MKNHEKMLMVVIVLAFVVVIFILTLGQRNQTPANANGDNPEVASSVEGTTENLENAKLVNDNVKLNTSTKMSETKTFGGLEISNVQLTSKDNVTTMLATVTNKTSQTAGDFAVKLTILDKDGNTITEAHGYISKVEPGKSTQLNISKTFDFANAYDYTIEEE